MAQVEIIESDVKKKPKTWLYVGVIVVIAILIGGGIYLFKVRNPTGPTGNVVNTGNAIDLQFYVMSQCPYGTQVEDSIKPVLDQLGPNINFKMDFIATDNGDGTFASLHGQNEVSGDIVQLCAMKYEPKKYMEMIACQNKAASSIPGNWEQCATDAKLNVAAIKKCYEGEEGKQLLKTSIAASEAAGAQGSPTIFLNKKAYNGGRGTSDFLRAICNEYSTTKPEACANIPAPIKVNTIILNDKRCADCDVSGVIGQLESIFPGIQVTEVDYSTPEGKALFEKTGVQYLPAILFDSTVEKGEGYPNVQRYLEPKAEYQNLRIGSQFDPTKEICDNKIDDNGNGLIDCQDPECAGNVLCRPEIKNNLQVFIMSDCPYGKKAVEALKSVVDNSAGSIQYEVHYIASENADGTFRSLHGEYEANENIVQLCVKKYNPQQWLNFLYCRSTNGIKGVDWKNCATETKVDTAKVETCATGTEGKQLLSTDIKIAQGLGISASPTWMANNKKMFSGIDAETVKQNYCSVNPTAQGCGTTLSTSAAVSGSCG